MLSPNRLADESLRAHKPLEAPSIVHQHLGGEVRDRLLPPVSTRTVAYAKMFVGILESIVSVLIVLPISLTFMGPRISIQMTAGEIPLLILVLVLTAIASAALALLVGTIVKPSQVAAMFPGFLMPVVFLGSIFYTWHQLSPLPVMQVIALLDPLTWINEAIREIMTPRIQSLPLALTIAVIIVWVLGMGTIALKRFHQMVYHH